MNIQTAYTIYNNGIQSIDPQLSEAIDRIIDHKNMQLEKLDRTELAEVKARMEFEQLEIKVKNQANQLIEYQKSFSKMKDQKWAVERMAYNRKQTIKELRSLVGKLQKRLKSANKVEGESNV